MSLAITLNDAVFANYLARPLPYLTDAEGVFFFGGSDAGSRANLAPNGVIPSGTWAGPQTPTIGGSYAEFSAAASFDSGINYEGHNKTIISISEFSADDQSSVVGPHLNFFVEGNAFRMHVRSSLAYEFSNANLISLNRPIFQALTSGASGGSDTSYCGRAGALVTDTTATESVLPDTISFGPRGGVGDINDTTQHKHYLGLVYSRELSGIEIAEVYDWAAEYFGSRGVVLS